MASAELFLYRAQVYNWSGDNNLFQHANREGFGVGGGGQGFGVCLSIVFNACVCVPDGSACG